MEQIESICDRSIWIHEGRIAKEGPVKLVNQEYLLFMEQQRKKAERKEVEKTIEKIAQIKSKSIAGKEIVDKTLEKIGVYIYLDRGIGFNQNDVIVTDAYVNKDNRVIVNETIVIDSNVKAIRFDPIEGRSSLVKRLDVSFETEDAQIRYSKSVKIKEGRLFMDTDPQIIIEMGRSNMKEFEIYAEYDIFPEEKVMEYIEQIVKDNERLEACIQEK